jgi:hypothetical protein
MTRELAAEAGAAPQGHPPGPGLRGLGSGGERKGAPRWSKEARRSPFPNPPISLRERTRPSPQTVEGAGHAADALLASVMNRSYSWVPIPSSWLPAPTAAQQGPVARCADGGPPIGLSHRRRFSGKEGRACSIDAAVWPRGSLSSAFSQGLSRPLLSGRLAGRSNQNHWVAGRMG